jgi:hypothetical protein
VRAWMLQLLEGELDLDDEAGADLPEHACRYCGIHRSVALPHLRHAACTLALPPPQRSSSQRLGASRAPVLPVLPVLPRLSSSTHSPGRLTQTLTHACAGTRSYTEPVRRVAGNSLS